MSFKKGKMTFDNKIKKMAQEHEEPIPTSGNIA
jgi:hypothetical protein